MHSKGNQRFGRAGLAVAGIAAIAGGVTLSLLDSSSAQSDGRAAPAFAVPGTNTRSFADVIEQVSPAVVNIAVTKVGRALPTSGGMRSPFEEFFGEFFGQGRQGMPVPERRSQGQGSGFIIDADGYIATNFHVVDGAEEITVTLPSGEALEAEVVGQDPQTDIALLRVDAASADLDAALPEVRFGDSDGTRIGDWVLAIGNPFGLGGTATAGIVSARGRDIASGPYDDYLQIDAPINSGNSGGPVFNAAGEVIGINTAIFSPNGGNIGIGFAIPSNQAELVLAQLRSDGTVTRGWLGVQIQDVDESIAEVFGLDAADGALVAEVVAGSPAADAGLEVGDVVVAVDEREIGSSRDLARAVGLHDAGEDVELSLIRDGRERTVDVELGRRAQDQAVARRPGSGPARGSAAGDLGLELDDLNAATRERYGFDADVAGAIVTRVLPGSEAAARGIRPGDVIVSVDRQPTGDADEVAAALTAARDADQGALVLVRRGDSQRFVALGAG